MKGCLFFFVWCEKGVWVVFCGVKGCLVCLLCVKRVFGFVCLWCEKGVWFVCLWCEKGVWFCLFVV